MTRARKTDKPTAEPLATKVRAALAQGWHTLDALESLAGRATGARLRVHAALGELRAAGCALEERVERGVAEVRLGAATGPAPVPDDGDGAAFSPSFEIAPLSPAAAARFVDLIENPPAPSEALRALCRGEEAPDAPAPLREPSPPVEGEPVDAASYYLGRGRGEDDDLDAVRAARGRDLRARVIGSLPPGATAREIMFAEAKEIVRMRGPVEPATAPDALALPCEPSASVALTLPAPRPDDGSGWGKPAADEPLSTAEQERAYALRMADECTAGEIEELRGYEAREETARGERLRREAEAVEVAQAPKGPGPGSRCAVCARPYASHDKRSAQIGNGHPFVAKPRGRPRVAALDAPAVESAAAVGAEPETTRGEAPGDQANGKQDESEATDVGTTDDGAEGSGAAPHPASGGKRARVRGQHAVHERVSGEVEGAGGRAPRRGGKADEPVRLTRPPRCPSVWHDVQCEREAGHPCGSEDEPGRHHSAHEGRSGWTDEAAARWAQRRAEERETARGGSRARRAAAAASPVVAPPCRPPQCHADDIHEPARVRGFARPLCERHRRWVEGAGGTVAAGGLAGVVTS